MVHNCRTYSLGDSIFYDKFTMQEMSVALEAMHCRKSPGSDNMHGPMVKHLGDKDYQRLLEIFNLSWKLGRLPWEWKRAIIIPVENPGKDSSSVESPSFFDLDRIHFQTELLTRMCKGSDVPEFTRQISLETIHAIPHSALKIYTGGISGSGMHIETPDDTRWDIWILTDSRASIQHLSRWTTVGDMTSLNILDVGGSTFF
ncbi:RNase H domain-containing protein [Trichonephila clavipes]|nr:RNase H domain-containing protein [Trichonephila clavipes]